MQKYKRLWIVILVSLSLISLTIQIDQIDSQIQIQTQCRNYYSDQTINSTGFCDQILLTCNFSSGFKPLLVNRSVNDPQPGTYNYSLCIIAPLYQINFGYNQIDVIIEIGAILIKSISINFIHPNPIKYRLNLLFKLIMIANNIQMSNVFISASSIWLQTAFTISITNTSFKNQSGLQSSCKCINSKSQCQHWNFSIPTIVNQSGYNPQNLRNSISFTDINFNSVILLSNQTVQIINSNISMSFVGIFANNSLMQNSSLSLSGLGYASDTGEGCGFFDEELNQLIGCSGTGGSHGGYGGNSYPNSCNYIVSLPPYGSTVSPYAPGSGGGFFLRESNKVSSGGGIINIQINNITLNNTQLNVSGKRGQKSGGGGSAGAILFNFNYLNVYGKNNISAEGGGGISSGGGGRVRIWNFKWSQINNSSIYLNGTIDISVKGGSQCRSAQSCGNDGSLLTSPCNPGYHLSLETYFCVPCPLGTFNIFYGYVRCTGCDVKPLNSYYIPGVNSSFESSCNFVCNEGYVYRDGLCMNNFEAVLSRVGGVNLIICIGIVIAAFIIYLIFLMIQRITRKQLFWPSKQQITKLSSKKYFQIEEIPYHQYRMYFSGNNTPKSPWHITQQQQGLFLSQLSQPLKKMSEIISITFTKINELAKYTVFQTICLYILKFYYYPLYRFLKDFMKWYKAEKVFQIVNEISLKIPDQDLIAMKVYVKPNVSVCCFEVFNYTKSVYDFYIQNYFPIYFQLQKLLVGDQSYCLDFSDPFMKALINQLSRKTEKNKNFQKYITELNSLLRNASQILPIINHLWLLNSYIPGFQAYLWQPPDMVIGIDKKFTIEPTKELFLVFSIQCYQKNHFLHERWLPSLYFDEIQSLKHKYNLRNQVLNDQKKSNRWEIKNYFNQKILAWMLGLGSILMLLLSFLGFFLSIFIISSHQKDRFIFGIVLYFCLLPLTDFFMSFLSLRAILSKQQRMLSYAIFFSLGIIIKQIVLFICGLLEVVQTGETLILMIFIVWVFQLATSIYSFILQMLLYPRLSQG